jgi:hypothetical protein
MAYLSKSTEWDGQPLNSPVRTSGPIWVLVLALSLLLVAHDRRPHSTPSGPNECATDPRDFLSTGELLDRPSLRFIIAAHCRSAKYRSDGWIELRYEGAPFGVETTQFGSATNTYYEIVWVGAMFAP